MIYVVESGKELQEYLDKEGYTILHRPYFAMEGQTYYKWTVDTDKKVAVDYAKKDVEEMTFGEFMKEVNDGSC